MDDSEIAQCIELERNNPVALDQIPGEAAKPIGRFDYFSELLTDDLQNDPGAMLRVAELKVLQRMYSSKVNIRADGNCFYRAVGFGYLFSCFSRNIDPVLLTGFDRSRFGPSDSVILFLDQLNGILESITNGEKRMISVTDLLNRAEEHDAYPYIYDNGFTWLLRHIVAAQLTGVCSEHAINRHVLTDMVYASGPIIDSLIRYFKVNVQIETVSSRAPHGRVIIGAGDDNRFDFGLLLSGDHYTLLIPTVEVAFGIKPVTADLEYQRQLAKLLSLDFDYQCAECPALNCTVHTLDPEAKRAIKMSAYNGLLDDCARLLEIWPERIVILKDPVDGLDGTKCEHAGFDFIRTTEAEFTEYQSVKIKQPRFFSPMVSI